MQNTLSARRRKRQQGSREEFPSLRDGGNNENSPPASLFFASGERRLDLDRPSTSEEYTKRIRVDAPVFYERGLRDGIQACEPAAGEALMGLATGKLLYYGEYYEQNKLLRELAFEREARQQFGTRSSSNLNVREKFNYGGSEVDDDDL